jgi:hypothetical protein
MKSIFWIAWVLLVVVLIFGSAQDSPELFLLSTPTILLALLAMGLNALDEMREAQALARELKTPRRRIR